MLYFKAATAGKGVHVCLTQFALYNRSSLKYHIWWCSCCFYENGDIMSPLSLFYCQLWMNCDGKEKWYGMAFKRGWTNSLIYMLHGYKSNKSQNTVYSAKVLRLPQKWLFFGANIHKEEYSESKLCRALLSKAMMTDWQKNVKSMLLTFWIQTVWSSWLARTQKRHQGKTNLAEAQVFVQ